MLSEYIAAAMERAEFKKLGDGTIFGEIPGIQGVWSNCDTEEDASEELREVLEDWIVHRLSTGKDIPEVGGIKINPPAAV